MRCNARQAARISHPEFTGYWRCTLPAGHAGLHDWADCGPLGKENEMEETPLDQRVEPRFVIKIRSKEFVLLAGLLDLAHRRGLKAIETELVESQCRPDQEKWIVRATGTFRAAEGDACWSAYGDADPKNSQMQGAYLRHAETRAIARMLRFATNVGMCSFEELGPDGDDSPPRQNGQEARSPAHTARPAPNRGHEEPLPPAALCDEPGCGVELTQTLVQYCIKRADKIDGRTLCAVHLEEFARLKREAGAAA